MDEVGVVREFWPIVERAASVAALLLAVACWWLQRELTSVRDQLSKSQESRIEEGKNIVGTLKDYTATVSALAELLRDRRER